MVSPAVFATEYLQPLGFFNDHQAAEQPLDGLVGVANLFRDVFQLDAKISVHIGDVARLGVATPFGRAVHMFEPR